MRHNKPRMREHAYAGLPKPQEVAVGQLWWNHHMRYERPYGVVSVVEKVSGTPGLFPKMVPYAMFRKGKYCECRDLLLSEQWKYLGVSVGEGE